jgi:hypothetical protein
MPQEFIYPSQDAVNNVVAHISQEAKNNAGVLVSELPDGTFKVTVADQYVDQLTGVDPSTPGAPALRDYAGNKRWNTEIAGTIVNGHPIATDTDSQNKVATLQASFTNGDLTGTIDFKLGDGTFVTASQADVAAFNDGIITHVQACYTAESNAVAAIGAGTCTTFAQVDTFFASIT